MNIEIHYKQIISYIESLDYSDTKGIIKYASKELFKYSSELSIIVMINALIKAPKLLKETLPEQVATYVEYEGSISIYKYIKNKLVENNDKKDFYHKEVFEDLLEVLENKYSEMEIDLKQYR